LEGFLLGPLWAHGFFYSNFKNEELATRSKFFMISHNLVLMATSQGVTAIPREIDDHLRMFGKEPWEVDYDLYGYCDMCNTRIDEFGFCACGGAAD